AGRGLPITRLLDRVRRLVRLGDDRDLRQLPAAAQHLDAVRLMTIHGAKGLEFGGVHIPGLNSDTIPRTPPAPPCPAPDGMIAGAEGSALEA
ncbi:3'-5' exonuclease, partial [Acinetobacter baumannii]